MVASNLNTGNETRITRRIIAEDNDWTLQTVPYLRTMALETIIQNWEEHPHLDELSEKERRKVLSKLRHRFKFILTFINTHNIILLRVPPSAHFGSRIYGSWAKQRET